MTLKQIADESDLNKSTALRMTTKLLNEKFLSQHDDKYCREFLSRQPLDRYTTTTQTEIPQIMERIQNIRDLQYVINNGEHDEGIVKQQSRQLS